MLKKSFTLIELLLVIAIIAALIGIAIPNVMKMRERGKSAKAKSDLRTLQTAVENYYVHKSAYPASLGELTAATPRVIKVLPTDPFSKSDAPYGYERGGTQNSYYVIYSIGVDRDGIAAITGDDEIEENNTNCIYVSNTGEDKEP